MIYRFIEIEIIRFFARKIEIINIYIPLEDIIKNDIFINYNYSN